MDQFDADISPVDQLAARVEAARREGRSYAGWVARQEPSAIVGLNQASKQLEADLSVILTGFQIGVDREDDWRTLHDATIAIGRAGLEHKKRVHWHEYVAGGARDSSFDVVAEYAELCAQLDQVWAQVEAALGRLYEELRKAQNKMTVVAIEHML